MAHVSTISQAESFPVAAHILCDACSRILKESKWVKQLAQGAIDDNMAPGRDVDIFLHSLDIDQLRKSSAAGCHICTMAIDEYQNYSVYDERGVIQALVWCSTQVLLDEDKVGLTLTGITNILASDFSSGDRDGMERALRKHGELDWQLQQQYENPIALLNIHWARGGCTRSDS